jgi:translation initiation factor IF-1
VAKQENVLLKGRIVEALPNAVFKVELETGHSILGHLAGKLRINKITIIPGDLVDLEISPYDTTKGRIMFRHKG